MHVNFIAIIIITLKGIEKIKTTLKCQQDTLNQSCKLLQVEWFILFSSTEIHFYVKLARTRLRNSAI